MAGWRTLKLCVLLYIDFEISLTSG